MSAIFLARRAHADEPTELHRPLTLPQLTHRYTEITLESTLALGQLLRRRSRAELVRPSASTACLRRSRWARACWFAGAAYGIATGHRHDGEPHVVCGNPELSGAASGPRPTGSRSAAGSGRCVPGLCATTSAPAIRWPRPRSTVRGWERAFFDPERAHASGRSSTCATSTGIFTVQYRQALEIATTRRRALVALRRRRHALRRRALLVARHLRRRAHRVLPARSGPRRSRSRVLRRRRARSA